MFLGAGGSLYSKKWKGQQAEGAPTHMSATACTLELVFTKKNKLLADDLTSNESLASERGLSNSTSIQTIQPINSVSVKMKPSPCAHLLTLVYPKRPDLQQHLQNCRGLRLPGSTL